MSLNDYKIKAWGPRHTNQPWYEFGTVMSPTQQVEVMSKAMYLFDTRNNHNWKYTQVPGPRTRDFVKESEKFLGGIKRQHPMIAMRPPIYIKHGFTEIRIRSNWTAGKDYLARMQVGSVPLGLPIFTDTGWNYFFQHGESTWQKLGRLALLFQMAVASKDDDMKEAVETVYGVLMLSLKDEILQRIANHESKPVKNDATVSDIKELLASTKRSTGFNNHG